MDQNLCELCKIKEEKYRIIEITLNSIACIIKWPLKEGHVMILPKRHITNISECSKEEIKDLLELSNKMKRKIEKIYSQSTITHINSGKHSSEEHIHIHVLPSKGSLRELISTYENIPAKKDNSNEEKTKIAEKIRNMQI